MALPILQISVDAVTISAIIGLIVRERMKNKREDKKPGNGKETNGLLKTIQADLSALKTSASTLDKNYAVIAEGIKGWHERCAAHLDTQATINLEVKNRIESLDEKIFKIVRKD
jgi:hypothetical protein